jgi:hypothetical protein
LAITAFAVRRVILECLSMSAEVVSNYLEWIRGLRAKELFVV